MMARCKSGWRLLSVALLLPVLISGCASAPVAPLAYVSYPRTDTARQPNLLVLLRGLGADHTVFAEEGVIDEIRNRELPFDVIAPDVHYGYYESQTFELRLKEDIIDPARKKGYKQIWLAGFSMGGLGCLLYLRSHPKDVDGVMLVSPFLGWSSIRREIRRAGGVPAWQNTSDDPADWQRMIWSWIKRYDPAASVPIWLGYGNNDILTADGPQLLATMLPAERVFSVPGNHTISTFKTIFLRHLDHLPRE